MSCSIDCKNYLECITKPTLLTLGGVLFGPINTVVKIGATLFSILSGGDNVSVNVYAEKGLTKWSSNQKWQTMGKISMILPSAYSALISFVPRVNAAKIAKNAEKIDFIGAFSDGIWNVVKDQIADMTAPDTSWVSQHLTARVVSFGGTLLVIVAKVVQLALGILAAGVSLATLGGFFGCLEQLNQFAYKSLQSVDMIDVLCWGLRHVVNPSQATVISTYSLPVVNL